MGKNLVITFVILLAAPAIALGVGMHTTWNPSAQERTEITTWMPPNPDDVFIGGDGISMPLNKFILARKGKSLCAIKFTDTWLGESKHDHFSSYEFYYQGDGSGDFTKANVATGVGELLFPRVKPIMFDMGYQTGRNTVLKCGDLQLDWLFIAHLDFPKKGELAPTPWTSIKEVNLKDPRIQWYKKDRQRNYKKNRIIVPIDHLWAKKLDAKKETTSGGH